MKKNFTIFKIIWKENKYPIAFIYFLNIIQEVFYVLIPSAVGLLIDSLIYNKGYGLIAFVVTYLG